MSAEEKESTVYVVSSHNLWQQLSILFCSRNAVVTDSPWLTTASQKLAFMDNAMLKRQGQIPNYHTVMPSPSEATWTIV